MQLRISVSRCIIVLLLLGFMGLTPETAKGDSLREQMITKAKKEGQFVIGGSAADVLRDKLKGFKKLYPFITLKPFVANTADTINRITAEVQAGKHSIDLAHLGSDGMELLAKMNLLEKMEFPHLKDFQAGTQPRKGIYVQGFLNMRVQGVYNTNLIPPNEVPKSWEDMLDPKWNGKTMISRSAEEIPAEIAFLWGKDGKLEWERSFDFFRKLMRQKPIIARGFRGGTSRVAAGESHIFWFPAVGPASRLHFQGAPLGLVAFPKFHATFRSFGILKGASNPASAYLFIDFITSPQGQFEFTEYVMGTVPVNKKAKAGKLGRWVMEQGGTLENAVPIDVSVFDNKIAKKSEDFFFKLIGIK